MTEAKAAGLKAGLPERRAKITAPRKKAATPPKVMAPPPEPKPRDGIPEWAKQLAQRVWDKLQDDHGFAQNVGDLKALAWRVDLEEHTIWRETEHRRMTVDQDGIRVDTIDTQGTVIPARGTTYPWPRQPRSRAPTPVRVT